MDSHTGPPQARSLVLELAARTAVVDGQTVELPPTEFSLLAVLAARPGEVVPHKELLQEAFGDSAYMDTQDLHWRIWKIRQLIGDTNKTIIRNRRGVGFVVEPGNVHVVDAGAGAPPEPEAQGVRPDDEPPDRQPGEAAVGHAVTVDDDLPDRRFVLSPVALVVLGLVAGLALAGSWVAGYTLPQRGEPPTAAEPPAAVSEEDPDKEERRPNAPRDGDNRQQRKSGNKKKKSAQKLGGGHSFAIAPGGASELAAGNTTSGTAPSSSGVRQKSGPRPKVDSNPEPQQPAPPPPPPPQPNAQLYHLHNPDTGDHIMTTSSSVANQKQASGYTSTPAGGVFTSQQKGTIAISLDGGTAFVYSSPSSAPGGLRVTALYRLSSGGDFFYTTSSSAANQAQAQGWSRSTGGYVVT